MKTTADSKKLAGCLGKRQQYDLERRRSGGPVPVDGAVHPDTGIRLRWIHHHVRRVDHDHARHGSRSGWIAAPGRLTTSILTPTLPLARMPDGYAVCRVSPHVEPVTGGFIDTTTAGAPRRGSVMRTNVTPRAPSCGMLRAWRAVAGHREGPRDLNVRPRRRGPWPTSCRALARRGECPYAVAQSVPADPASASRARSRY